MPATDDYLRKPKIMHRWFAGSMVLMFIAFIWMTAADHSAEWKDYQSTFYDIQIATLETQRQEYAQSESLERVNQLKTALKLADDDLNQRKEAIDTLQGKIDQASRDFDLMSRQVRSTRADRDVARANFDLGVRDALDGPTLAQLKTEFDQLQAKVDQEELELEQVNASLDLLTAELKTATAERDKAADRLAQADKEHQLQLQQLDELAPSVKSGGLGWINVIKRTIMEWPIIDGFNSHLRIHQDWLPDLPEKLGMTSAARFDRCRTCHLGINTVAAGNIPTFPHGDSKELGEDYHDWVKQGKFPHPYSTHPNPDLYTTSTSPHPVETFGCTICHEGQGSGTSFQNASHGPDNPVQELEWEHEYSWFDNHFWEYPMMPKRFQESQCIKCHHNVVELGVHPKFGASAPKVYEGYQLIRSYGCFGCHEINGFKGTDPIGPDLRLEPQTAEEAAKIAADPNQIAGKMRKVGPSLRHIASKVQRGWIEDWVNDPTNFRPTTRMPRFFHLTNQQDELAQEYQPVEIAAIAQFLLKNSEEFKYLEPQAGYTPDPERGKLLFSQKGCLACHSHSDFPGTTADFGPELNKVHAKLPAGRNGFLWLYSWIKEPTRYHARTKMPDLYLDPYKEGESEVDPAADIASYLLQQGSQDWAEIEVDDAALDALVELFLRDVLTEAQFEQFMKTRDLSLGGKLKESDLKGDERELWLGVATEDNPIEVSDEQWKELKLKYVGRRTVTRYGCYGCHDVAGFEEARPIGTALQDWGRKDRTKLAPEHIEEFLHLEEYEFLIVPLREGEVTDEILSQIDSERRFKQWAEERRNNDTPADDPIQETVRETELSPTLGDVEELEGLDAGHWTEEPFEHDGKQYLVLLEEKKSMHERVEGYVRSGLADEFTSEAEEDYAMSVSYFVENLMHHGRAGFAWQKIRQPRSYDFEKVETKKYSERLRMPKFPFDQHDIEAITTFVLGLVADPPMEKYLYRPDGADGDRISGEYLLQQFNCTGCHVVQMPKYEYQAKLDDFPKPAAGEPVDNAEATNLLSAIVPPRHVTVPGHITEFPLKFTGIASDVIDDLGETPKGWQDFVNAPGETAAEKAAAIGWDGDSDPAEWEFYITLWENLVVERAELSKPVYPPTEEGEPLVVALADDKSVNAVIRLDESSGDLIVSVVGEDQESALAPQSVSLILDLVSGTSAFDLAAEGEGFVLKGPEVPEDLTSLKQLYGRITVKFPDVHITPSSRIGFVGEQLKGMEEGRGGDFTQWLVDELVRTDKDTDGRVDNAWNYVAPPLVREGAKVQTPWLYRFLMNPEKLRHMTKLRMPKFNMSEEEAQILANYFAAVDETPYPYQRVPQKEAPYQRAMNEEFHEKYSETRTDNYLSETWQMFMFKANKCVGCHSVAGRPYLSAAKEGEPEVRGPDLTRVENRLQPDWVHMWIFYPKWATPYTKMPQNYPLDKPSSVPLFGQDPQAQTKAVRDALMNHAHLLETQGVKIWGEAAPEDGTDPATSSNEEKTND